MDQGGPWRLGKQTRDLATNKGRFRSEGRSEALHPQFARQAYKNSACWRACYVFPSEFRSCFICGENLHIPRIRGTVRTLDRRGWRRAVLGGGPRRTAQGRARSEQDHVRPTVCLRIGRAWTVDLLHRRAAPVAPKLLESWHASYCAGSRRIHRHIHRDKTWIVQPIQRPARKLGVLADDPKLLLKATGSRLLERWSEDKGICKVKVKERAHHSIGGERSIRQDGFEDGTELNAIRVQVSERIGRLTSPFQWAALAALYGHCAPDGIEGVLATKRHRPKPSIPPVLRSLSGYHLEVGGHAYAPFASAQLQQMVVVGHVTARPQIWREGSANWQIGRARYCWYGALRGRCCVGRDSIPADQAIIPQLVASRSSRADSGVSKARGLRVLW